MLSKLRTFRALGLGNAVRVATYRLGLRLGVHPVLKIGAETASGPFFRRPDKVQNIPARKEWQDGLRLFAHHDLPEAGIPDWHRNYFSGAISTNSRAAWSTLPDFDPAIGDIKTIWDLSRYDWVLAMAQRASKGQQDELDRLNRWLADWVTNNPAYLGINWKCGQEASLRVVHLAAAALLLDQTQRPETGLLELVRAHLKRIAPTMGYAIGQANNHGTSEAAALFIGGSWLSRSGVEGAEAWMRTGRKWLEDRAQTLISADGSFSQYSTIYHRMVLDTYAFCEVWRKRWELEPFTPALRKRLAAATDWLEAMTDPTSGDAVNLGANDGTQILKLSDASYRDFRPSLQRASLLFRGTRAVSESGPWDDEAIWLGIDLERPRRTVEMSRTFDDGGYHVLRKANAMAMLRYPRFKFRPSQADALHLDFWRDGVNLLRDAGTFSYNHPAADDGYFSSVRAHNSVEFDGRDQMPKLSRFLYADWLRTDSTDPVTETDGGISAAAQYSDAMGASHLRSVKLDTNQLAVIDTVHGVKNSAVMRWRLVPGEYTLEGHQIKGKSMTINLLCSAAFGRVSLTTGRASLNYLEWDSLPVLEVEVTQDCTVTTQVQF